MLERSKDCQNEEIMRSLQEVIKRTFKGIIGTITGGGLLMFQKSVPKFIYLFIYLFQKYLGKK